MGQLYVRSGDNYIPVNRLTVISDVSVGSKDVNFYDGYGVRVAAYSFADAANMTVLPAFPVRSGISFSKWSKTISEVKAATEPLDVFAVGGSADGKTKLFIAITSALRATIPLYIQQSVSGGVSIDWGDGSEAQTISGTGAVNTTHTYAAVGDYIISFTVNSGTLGFGNNSTASVIGGTSYVYKQCIKGCVIGNGVESVGRYAFCDCANLEYCIIPESVSSVGVYAFSGCYGLRFIGIPNTVLSVSRNAFYNCATMCNAILSSGLTLIDLALFGICRVLENTVMPPVTSIGESAFAHNYRLSFLIIPSTVTNIGANAFNNCLGLKTMKYKPTTPPTVADSNAWTNIPTDCVIEVPSANLAAYQAATNYGPVVARMTGV